MALALLVKITHDNFFFVEERFPAFALLFQSCSLIPTPLLVCQLALTREQELENKLASMQEVLNSARQLATESMIVCLF